MKPSKLQTLADEIAQLASSLDIKVNCRVQRRQFSLFYFGRHVCPESWQVSKQAKTQYYNVNYFAFAKPAYENLTLLGQRLPNSRLVRPFLLGLERYADSAPGELFCKNFLTEKFAEIDELLKNYMKILRKD